MYSSIAEIPRTHRIVPVINDAEMKGSTSYTIEAELEDGSIVKGQSRISHPGGPASMNMVNKIEHGQQPLSSRIREIRYIDDSGNRVKPTAHEAAIQALLSCDIIVFAQVRSN